MKSITTTKKYLSMNSVCRRCVRIATESGHMKAARDPRMQDSMREGAGSNRPLEGAKQSNVALTLEFLEEELH